MCWLHPLQLANAYKSGKRLPQANCNTTIFKIINSCWMIEPTQRPSFDELAANLRDLLQSILNQRGESTSKQNAGNATANRTPSSTANGSTNFAQNGAAAVAQSASWRSSKLPGCVWCYVVRMMLFFFILLCVYYLCELRYFHMFFTVLTCTFPPFVAFFCRYLSRFLFQFFSSSLISLSLTQFMICVTPCVESEQLDKRVLTTLTVRFVPVDYNSTCEI